MLKVADYSFRWRIEVQNVETYKINRKTIKARDRKQSSGAAPSASLLSEHDKKPEMPPPLTVCLNSGRDVLAEALVHVEHVQVDAPQLDDEGVSHGLAGSDVGLQDAAQLLDGLRVLQDVHVLSRRGTEEG